MQEELKKEKSNVQALNKNKNDLEKNVSKLAADFKALKEKSETVSLFLFSCFFFTATIQQKS